MADETASFNLNVESNAAQIAADGAQGLANFQEKMQGSVVDLRNMNAAFRSLKGAAGVSGSALDELKGKIAAQKAAVAAQNQAYIKAGGTFKELAQRNKAESAREAAAKKVELEANKKILAQGKESDSLKAREIAKGALMASGILAVAVVALEAARSLGEAAKSFVAYGIAAAGARRSELLSLEGMSKIRYGLGGLMGGYRIAADSAGMLQSTLDQVSDGSAVGRDKLAGYEAQLYRTGLRAGNLRVALEGMAIVASTQGDEQANRFAGMVAGARMAGVSVKALADDVKARLGGIAAAQMLSLDVQSAKLHESFQRLFTGLKLEPLLKGVREVTSLFSQNTVQGKAMATLLDAMFQPLIDGAPTAGRVVKKVITGILIGLGTLYDLSLRAQIAWIEIFGSKKALTNMGLAHDACVAAAIGVGLLAGFATVAVATTVELGVALYTVGSAASELMLAVDALDTRLKKWGSSAAGLGKDFVLGIADGILGGIPSLVMSVAQLGDAAIKAFRNKLDMHSPSRVMFGDGRNIVRGQIGGIRAERPALEAEVRASMVRPVMAPFAGGVGNGMGAGVMPSPTAAPSRSAPATVTFGDIVINGATDAASVRDGLRRGVEQLLSGALIMAGGSAP